jgi:hypothetical protein
MIIVVSFLLRPGGKHKFVISYLFTSEIEMSAHLNTLGIVTIARMIQNINQLKEGGFAANFKPEQKYQRTWGNNR